MLSSQPAYVLAEPGLFPEGMAFDGRTGRVYAGGAATQRVVWTDRSGVLQELVRSRAGGLGFPAGMKVDARRKQLCVASAASFGPGKDAPGAVTGILCFALADGRHVTTLRLPADRTGFLNDLAIDPSTGTIDATNTSTGAVMQATARDTELRELLPDEAIPGANGITLDSRTGFIRAAWSASRSTGSSGGSTGPGRGQASPARGASPRAVSVLNS